MKKLMLAAVLCCCAMLVAYQVSAQDDLKEIKDEAAFGTLQRPAVPFDHNAHNEKAKIDDCGTCHHGGENGHLDPNATSEGTPCSECHKVKPTDKTTSLMRAFHKQCISCHTAQKKGPVACGECHQRQK